VKNVGPSREKQLMSFEGKHSKIKWMKKENVKGKRSENYK
jgi:hypothetical protein